LDSNILNALLRDPVINRLTAAQPASIRASLPETLVAKVISLKGDLASLRWQDGSFTASLSARVTPGETLLLKYNGVKQGSSHYRIMARFPLGGESGEVSYRDSNEPLLFGMMPETRSGRETVPALVRFLPQKKGGADSGGELKPLLELFIDTESFGLVLARFYYHKDDRLQCRFIVESQEAGEALQGEAERLIEEAGGTKSADQNDSLHWSVGNLRRSAAEVLHQGGFSLNTQA
jgi:hypothetical protein